MNSFRKIYPSFLNSLRGLWLAVTTERAFRQEVYLGVIFFPLALWLAQSGVELALLWGSLLLVLVVELLNSGIESAIDRSSTEHHPLSARAKDFGSAAVFLALLNAMVTWGAVVFL